MKTSGWWSSGEVWSRSSNDLIGFWVTSLSLLSLPFSGLILFTSYCDKIVFRSFRLHPFSPATPIERWLLLTKNITMTSKIERHWLCLTFLGTHAQTQTSHEGRVLLCSDLAGLAHMPAYPWSWSWVKFLLILLDKVVEELFPEIKWVLLDRKRREGRCWARKYKRYPQQQQ